MEISERRVRRGYIHTHTHASRRSPSTHLLSAQVSEIIQGYKAWVSCIARWKKKAKPLRRVSVSLVSRLRPPLTPGHVPDGKKGFGGISGASSLPL